MAKIPKKGFMKGALFTGKLILFFVILPFLAYLLIPKLNYQVVREFQSFISTIRNFLTGAPKFVLLGLLLLLLAYFRKKKWGKERELTKGALIFIGAFFVTGWLRNLYFRGLNSYITSFNMFYILPLLSYYIYRYMEEIGAFLKFIWEKVSGFFVKISKFVWAKLKSLFSVIKNKFAPAAFGKVKGIKDKRKKLSIAAAVILGLILLKVVLSAISGKFLVTVADISPKGEVDTSVTIRAEFTAPVKLKNETTPAKLLDISPDITGVYEFQNEKTIVFKPDAPLPPAASYTVKVNTENFAALGKKIVGGKKVSFNTPLLKIVDHRYFFDRDVITDTEKELIGEINFNYPVEEQALKNSLRAFKKVVTSKGTSESPLEYRLEKSDQPTRYYIKIKDFNRIYDRQYIKVLIQKDLMCAECKSEMGTEYAKEIGIPSKEYLSVTEVIPWHTEGSSSVAVGFNMPISEEQVKKHIMIIKPASFGKEPEVLPFKVSTEYRFAMLEADFQPNITYEVNVSKGIVAKTGEPMPNDYSNRVTLKDMPSMCDFAEQGEILSPDGNMNIAVKTMNLDRFNVYVNKVFKNNLVYYLSSGSYYNTGKRVFDTVHEIYGGQINQEQTEFINMKSLNDQPFKGVFFVELRDQRTYETKRKTVRCTDIGLMAKVYDNTLLVKAVSVTKLNPMSGVTVKLMSTDNQVIKQMTTDAEGRVQFDNYNKNFYEFNPFLILAENGEDFSYLTLGADMTNNYLFDTGGERNGEYGLKGFLTSERGLYRPGEKAFITAIVRGDNNTTPPALFVECVIQNPQGGNFYIKKVQTNTKGMAVFEVPIALGAQTGEYSVQLIVPDSQRRSIGSTSIKIEEFIPDKINVAITTDKETLIPGDPLRFRVKANQMFGPPAAGNKVNAQVEFVQHAFTHPSFKGYVFSDPERSYDARTERLGTEKLNEIGNFDYEVRIPGAVLPPSALMAEVYAEVFDDGGRAVGTMKRIPVHVYKYYLGVKVHDERKVYKKGDKVIIDLAAVNGEGVEENIKDVQVLVKRTVWYSMFRRNRWNRDYYASSNYSEVVINKAMDINGKATLEIDADTEGEYTIYAGSEQGMRTGIKLNVSGPGYTTYDMTKADRVEIVLDKDKYLPGDKMKAVINAPFSGRAYVTLEREKVFAEKYIELENGSAVVYFDIKDEYLPNVYLNVMAVRKPEEKYTSLPFMSAGIATVSINRSAKDLAPKIICGEEVMSTDGINVKVRLGKAKANAAVVLAAVDEGILQIIRFETPDPLEYYYRKKALETQSYSIMNKVLTDVNATKRAIGGDYYEPLQKHLNPVIAKRVESFARFSGILYTDENGEVSYKFESARFNGKARIMVLAVDGGQFGSADKFVNIVDPIVITPNLPRFLALLDEFEMPVRIYNNTGFSGTFTARIDTQGPITVSKGEGTEIYLENKKEKKLTFSGKALKEAGAAKLDINVTGNGQKMSVKRELSIRPAAHLETKVVRGKLEPGKEITGKIPQEYIKFGKKVRLFVSKSRLAEYAPALEYLVRYPYGCLEQTVSSVFPMLYLKDLGVAQWMIKDYAANVDAYIEEGIKKLNKFVMGDGTLTYWPGGNGAASRYLSLYTAHFLVEAKRQGYNVPEDLYRRVLDRLGIKENPDEPAQQQGRLDRRAYNQEISEYETSNNIYKMYIQALVGRPDTKKMNYIESLYMLYLKKDKKVSAAMKEFAKQLEKTKYLPGTEQRDIMVKGGLIYKDAKRFIEGTDESDKMLLSMSYSYADNRDAAKMVLYEDFKSKYMLRELSESFNSYTRNLGMYLKAAAQAEAKETARTKITENLLIERVRDDGSFGSTQETAWALMGLAELNNLPGRNGEMSADLYVNGAKHSTIKDEGKGFYSDTKNVWKEYTVKNSGETPLYYNFYTEGTPLEKRPKSYSNGLKVSRKYFDENGKEINLTNVVQGKLIVVSVELEALNGRSLDNVIVVDMLPAGFEIENPRLRTSGFLKFTPASDMALEYQDIRDDRILLFTGAFSGKTTFSYAVRAVTPGKYTIPNIFAEAMYDPDIKAETHEKEYLVVSPEAIPSKAGK
ncbi:MAG: hypothetical protein CVV21_10805 [Candidatus Goldiibacteriota bacterium HGW-Goldbacteria-1]|jgi:hypothetical protein|nr:MAG: hypothetical protein CVV21_10805 [Candidatus Goldiibacteriota bacterium HGW-Goldbacteria-1]